MHFVLILTNYQVPSTRNYISGFKAGTVYGHYAVYCHTPCSILISPSYADVVSYSIVIFS